MNNEQNNGGPAFPVNPGDNAYGGTTPESLYGMTLRDWFAGQAVGPLIELAHRSDSINDDMPVRKSTIARWSREIADYLIAELHGDTEADPEGSDK